MALEKHPMWRLPQHHQDLKHAHDHVHWVELFYDLIHVVIIFLLGNYLSDHLSPQGFFVFLGLFTAIWYAWGDSSVFNSLYVSTDINHRLIMAMQIVTSMVMAASIPSIHAKGWVYFALAYAANRLITAYLYYRTKRLGVEETCLADRACHNFLILGVVFAISAFLPAPYSYWLFAAGVVCIQLSYMLPKLGVLESPRFIPRMGHMAERFSLLLLIVVGEGFFKLVITLSEKGIYKVSPSVLFNFIIGGIAVFVTCWIYFDFVGNGKPKDTSKKSMVSWWLAHLIVMASAVMMGVALAGEVKVGFLDPYPYKYGVIGCIGLASYLLGLLWIKHIIEPRVAHRFATTSVQLLGVFLALVTLLIIPYVPAIVGNLVWGSALFLQIIIPVTRAYRTLSAEEREQEEKEADTNIAVCVDDN